MTEQQTAEATTESKTDSSGFSRGLIGLTVDVVIFSLRPKSWLESDDESELAKNLDLQVLLIKRAREPYAGRWALPGGFVRDGETLEQAAGRQLAEKTALRPAYLEQLYTFSQIDRDPRRQTVSVAYYALVRTDNQTVVAGRDTAEVRWFGVDQLPALAFDHDVIMRYGLWRLRNKIKYANLAHQFLPPTFTLTQLREVYEVVRGEAVDPANFKRKVEASGTIQPTGAKVEGGRHRPPALYRAVVQAQPFDRGPYS